MLGEQIHAACTTCKAELVLTLPGPGRHAVVCSHCQTPGVVDVPPGVGATRTLLLRKPSSLRKLAHFDAVYHEFQPIAAHVPPARWALLGVYLGAIGFAEFVLVMVSQFAGLIVHATVLALFLLHAGLLANRSEPTSRLAMALSLIPLIRIVSLTTPLSTFGYVQWFLLIGAVMAAAIYAFIRVLKPTPEEVRLVMPAPKYLPLEIGIALVGIPLGVMEYILLKPGPVVESLTLVAIVGPALLLIAAQGFIEETIFRGILPRYVVPVFGAGAAILVPAVAQTLLDFANLNALHVALIFAVAIGYGVVARRTGSILGVGLSHGLANVMLFLVMPLTGFMTA